MTIDRVKWSLRRNRTTAMLLSALVFVAVLWGWWVFGLDPLEKWYLPLYVRVSVLSVWNDKATPLSLFVVGGDVANQQMMDANVSGLRYDMDARVPSRVRESLRRTIYHGSLAGRFVWPVGLSLLLWMVAFGIAWARDQKRIDAMRGDGWQIKGRAILTPDEQGRRTPKGGLEVWTEN